MEIWNNGNLEKRKSGKMDMRQKGNWTLGKMIFGEKWILGKIQIWKYSIMEKWKLEKMDMRKNGNLEK